MSLCSLEVKSSKEKAEDRIPLAIFSVLVCSVGKGDWTTGSLRVRIREHQADDRLSWYHGRADELGVRTNSAIRDCHIRRDALPAIPPEGQRQEVSDCFLCTGPELALSTQQLSSPDRREVVGTILTFREQDAVPRGPRERVAVVVSPTNGVVTAFASEASSHS
ncbi:hypothetical protein U0070_024735 [Myodes glareolus]|uniref:Uncharacterized protein n=1 Tax=Myodes glareolus TaxID=447135 RepID=A0AAW0HW83_MYOGA